MKFTLIATTFAILLATGYSETLRTPGNRNLDAVVPASEVVDLPTFSSSAEEGNRALVVEGDVNAADVAGEAETGGKRALGTKGAPSGGNKKDYSGQSCSLCCDDDYHC
jgi:hypothetical protein